MTYIELIKKYQGNFYVRAAALVVVVFIVVLTVRFSGTSATEVVSIDTLPSVRVASAANLSGGDTLSLIGTVRAFTEAQITTERSGRVTSVSATLGGQVAAGQVIATLENASEQASVLQAEGAYEAALAAAAQSIVGVSEASSGLEAAERGAVNAFNSAFNTVNNTVISNIDQFFSNPNTTIPGLRIAGKGLTEQLNTERRAYQTLLPEWQAKTLSINENSDLLTELTYANTQVQRTIAFVDAFITVFSAQSNDARYTDTELSALQTEFTNLRGTLLNTQSNLNAARTNLSRAEDAVARAEISSTGGTTSTADAQVKQALGSLRAAQANLAKTVLRSPISGTVNSLNIKVGDFIGSFETVSVIANNNALEIVTFVGDAEKEQLVVGDTVVIEGNYEGIITQIAPAVDQQTKKTEVRIATSNTNISNGNTVRITKEAATSTPANTTRYIPITAVKFEAENGFVFMVENEVLVSRPVTVGAIRSSQVEIISGITDTEEFVLDARGLSVGTRVQVTR